MKIEIPFLAALIFLGSDLLVRVAAQGFEQALFAKAIEWSMHRIKAGPRKFSAGLRR